MSYCLGMRLKDGLVFMSDSRTNAGVDSVASFSKSFVFDDADDRCIVLLTAGNLAITQAVISILNDSIRDDDPEGSIYNLPSMYQVAKRVGAALREVFDCDAPYLKKQGMDFNASIILGGQIKGRSMRLFNIYAAGNFIEATEETPYFQIGEAKYGRPILQRVLQYNTPLTKAVKAAIVSFDSTIQSNLSVGLPIDLVICKEGSLTTDTQHRLGTDDPYYSSIRSQWGIGLGDLFERLPEPDWLEGSDATD